MHFHSQHQPKCSHRYFLQIFTASALAKRKGVPLAIKDTVSFQLLHCVEDIDGPYIILVCLLNNSPYTIDNVYAANTHQVRFLKKLHKKVSKIQHGSTIWYGDFNIPPDPNSIPPPQRTPCIHLENEH